MYHVTPPFTPSNVSPGPVVAGSAIDVDDIQGDVLVGLQKNVEVFHFFSIVDVPAFKLALRAQILKRVTSTRLVIAREFQLRDVKTQPLATNLPSPNSPSASTPAASGGPSSESGTVEGFIQPDQPIAGQPQPLPLIGLNIGFTYNGIQKLFPEASFDDTAFVSGAPASAPSLGDPVVSPGNQPAWDPMFLNENLHGVFLITAGSLPDAQAMIAQLLASVGPCVQSLGEEIGNVRPGPERGHEHFGFADGISQPAVLGLSEPFPGQRAIDAGRFVFGYSKAPDAAQWMNNGSFMVFRRLKQLVPEFAATLESEANRLGINPDLLGARMMGRWKSGAQTVDAPLQDDAELGADAFANNDFDFSDDKFQRACPYGAHIRKLNPRQDLPDQADSVDPHRILRQGIPFGPEVTDAEVAQKQTLNERGLLFVCYQTSILQQFEFLQKSWANNPQFVIGQTRPAGGADASQPVVPEFDPIIGQNSAPGRARTTDEAFPNFPAGFARSKFSQATDAVIPQGGAYFFMPSISALATTLSA